MNIDQTFKIKIILIGDSATGKSSLLLRFIDDCFSHSFITTIGIDFKQKKVEINNKPYVLQVWDTAGCERFRSITTAYYRGAHVVFLVFDVGNAQSFGNVKNWLSSLANHITDNTTVILIGNKCDLTNRAVTQEQAQDFANKYNIPYIETSALTGHNVQHAFMSSAQSVVRAIPASTTDNRAPHPSVRPQVEPTPPDCC